MIFKDNIKEYDCWVSICKTTNRLCYLIYPALEPFSEEWVERMTRELNVSLVIIYVPAEKWNDALTPWPEPGEAKRCPPFAGKASDFLKILQNFILPEIEKKYNLDPKSGRDLMGVSLGGLFTLWQWIECDTFTSIACLSGSFWYVGFMEWFDSQTIKDKQGKAYFLLGEEEPHSHVKAFQSVGKNTEAIVDTLRKDGIKVEFDWVPGNHFSSPVHRAEKALTALYGKIIL